MIPLLHIITAISFLLCCFIAKRLYVVYQKTKIVNIGDFFKAYISLGFYFFLVSLPMVLSNGILVQITYVASYIPVILSAAFLFRVAMRILEVPINPKYISYVIYILIAVVTLLNLFFFSPAYIAVSNHLFYHWVETTPFFLQIFNGIILLILVVGCAILFFWGGIKSRDRIIRMRAFIIGSGVSLLVLAVSANYVLAPPGRNLEWKIAWWLTILAALLAISGLILILAGINYGEQKNEQKKENKK